MTVFIETLQHAITSRAVATSCSYAFLRMRARQAATLSPEDWRRMYLRENQWRAVEPFAQKLPAEHGGSLPRPSPHGPLYGHQHDLLTMNNRAAVVRWQGDMCQTAKWTYGTFFAAANLLDSYLYHTNRKLHRSDLMNMTIACVYTACALREARYHCLYLTPKLLHEHCIREFNAEKGVVQFQGLIMETLNGDFNFNYTPIDFVHTWLASMYAHPLFGPLMAWLETTDILLYIHELTLAVSFICTVNGLATIVPPSHICAAVLLMMVVALQRLMARVRVPYPQTFPTQAADFIAVSESLLIKTLLGDICNFPGGYPFIKPHLFWVSEVMEVTIGLVANRPASLDPSTLYVPEVVSDAQITLPPSDTCKQWFYFAVQAMYHVFDMTRVGNADKQALAGPWGGALPKVEIEQILHEHQLMSQILAQAKANKEFGETRMYRPIDPRNVKSIESKQIVF